MPLYLGIDGGQSSTIALIGDESGRVIGEGRAGPCNHVGASERRAKFLSAVGDSVNQAAAQAVVKPVFAACCAGFSGGFADKDALTRELIRANRYLITHDAHIALSGATAGGPGIVAIAGTGSIAYGRNDSGLTARAGGWGYVYGDEGSAFDLVRQAVRMLLREQEGWGAQASRSARGSSHLRDGLLNATACPNAHALLHRFYTDEYPRERVAALAPLIDQAAAMGDPAALELLSSAAQSLATFAIAVRRNLFPDTASVNVHHIGGVFHSDCVLTRFRMLLELDGETRVLAPQHGPAHGALLEAYKL
ncbi:MAG: BadF/BadG/BcrA/BcrD ATPase family protein [Acidobacteriota bacterium]